MGSIGSGITVYFIPRTVLVFVWLVYGGRLQCLLSKPLEEVQIEMTNDSSFLSNASFRSGANRVKGSFELPLPTPPCMRVRTGRFTEPTGP